MKNKQLRLDLYKGKHGGRRPGAGRKRIHSRGVAHRIRDENDINPRKKDDCFLDKETSYLMKSAIHELQSSSHSTRSE